MNITLEIETGKVDRKANREVTKKAKTQGSYSGRSNYSGPPITKVHNIFLQRRVTSSKPSPMSAPTLGSQVGSMPRSNLRSFGYSAPSILLC